MKTLKEFDYDLWAIEENGRKRYFARIKATGEETEVSLEVMRLLLSQEKQMRREYAKQQTIGPVLSLDAIRDGGSMDEAAWLLDTRQRIDSEVLTAELTDAFCKTLTDSQMETLQETITQIKEHGGEHREWMAQFRKHLNIAELERSIVVALIDRILIYRDNRVEVRFRFADEFAWQTDILRRAQIREVV